MIKAMFMIKICAINSNAEDIVARIFTIRIKRENQIFGWDCIDLILKIRNRLQNIVL